MDLQLIRALAWCWNLNFAAIDWWIWRRRFLKKCAKSAILTYFKSPDRNEICNPRHQSRVEPCCQVSAGSARRFGRKSRNRRRMDGARWEFLIWNLNSRQARNTMKLHVYEALDPIGWRAGLTPSTINIIRTTVRPPCWCYGYSQASGVSLRASTIYQLYNHRVLYLHIKQ